MLIDKGCADLFHSAGKCVQFVRHKNIVGCYFDFFYGLRRVGGPFHWDFTVCVHELIAVRLQSLCCAVRAVPSWIASMPLLLLSTAFAPLPPVAKPAPAVLDECRVGCEV